jgi:hypothetical protein
VGGAQGRVQRRGEEAAAGATHQLGRPATLELRRARNGGIDFGLQRVQLVGHGGRRGAAHAQGAGGART